jgi:hypothetical protein
MKQNKGSRFHLLQCSIKVKVKNMTTASNCKQIEELLKEAQTFWTVENHERCSQWHDTLQFHNTLPPHHIVTQVRNIHPHIIPPIIPAENERVSIIIWQPMILDYQNNNEILSLKWKGTLLLRKEEELEYIMQNNLFQHNDHFRLDHCAFFIHVRLFLNFYLHVNLH